MKYQSQIRHLAHIGVNLLRPETVHFQGETLPAQYLRTGGIHFRSNEAFLKSGCTETERLTKTCNLLKTSRLLDIGCGQGRLPIGIIHTLGNISCYRGMDVSRASIRWCTRHITKAHPTFQFHHIDAFNERYNKSGEVHRIDTPLPFDDTSFDIIYLYSVFSHLLDHDITFYLREFSRLLSENGRIFLTAFVEENVPDSSENPSDFGDGQWKGPLHCVRYNKDFFEDLLRSHKLTVHSFSPGTETDGQSAYILSHAILP